MRVAKWLITVVIVGGLAFALGRLNQADHTVVTHDHEVIGEVTETGSSGPKKYACPMLCTILPEPGECPVCGMDMTEVGDGQSMDASGEVSLSLGPEAMVLSELAVAPVQYRSLNKHLLLDGKLVYDESRKVRVSADFAGRIDRMFVDYTGMRVSKGDHVAELFSPDLVVLQKEYQLAKNKLSAAPVERQAAAQRSLDSVLEKMRAWRVTREQIQAMDRGAEVDQVTLNAPVGGIVVQRFVLEGDFFKKSEPLLTIADTSELWLMLDVYESDLHWLRYGQTVTFTVPAYPGEQFAGEIVFFPPELNESTRSIQVRVNVPNTDHRLRPGMFAEANVTIQLDEKGQPIASFDESQWVCPMHWEVVANEPTTCRICEMDLVPAKEALGAKIKSGEGQPLVVPASAPLITGKRALVYVEKEPGVYVPRKVTLGSKANDFYVVLNGLEAGEKVVVNGAFKLDSEMQIRGHENLMTLAEAEHSRHEAVSAERVIPSKPQTLCPVMGNEINKELYADVLGKRIYVCCPPCVAKVKSDPEKYIVELEADGVVLEESPKAEGKPQTLCPVMANEINKDLYADVLGKRIYVCCPPCVAKIESDPEKFIKELESAGVVLEESPKVEVKPQTLCPVMGNKINKELYADVLGKRIYVCCPPCVAKIEADPEKFIKELESAGVILEESPKIEEEEEEEEVLADQTICPVMGRSVDRSIFVDVDGFRIYLCCVPCFEIFNSDPAGYIQVIRDNGMKLTPIPKKEKAADAEQVKEIKDDEAAAKEGQPDRDKKVGEPQTMCPVMNVPINKDFYADVKGKRVYVCCSTCVADVKTFPDKWLKKLADAGVALEEAQEVIIEPKPQALCPVMGGAIDKTLFVDVNGYRIYVCCAACKPLIKNDPAPFIKNMKDAGVILEEVPSE